MEPTADTESLPTIFALADDNFLNGVEALARLNLEEDELIPTWRNAFTRNAFGLRDAIRTRFDGIELKGASPFGLPALVIREGHVEDIRDSTGANDVVVVE